MPRKAVLLALAALGCGIGALVLYSLEGSRLAVRDHGVAVQGRVVRSWTSKARRSSRTQHWVDYAYVVDGATFKAEERHVRGPLVEGGPLQVWFDPRSPDRCVSDPELRYGRDLKFVFILGFCGFFSLVAAGMEMLRRPAAALKA